MGLNSLLALAALVIWGGSYGWYFVGTGRLIRLSKQAVRRVGEAGRRLMARR